MGEPIRLWKGKEEVTVNGTAEAAALVGKGWQVGPRPADVEAPKAADVLANAQPAPPAMDAAPVAEEKPVKKHAGEYGTGPGTQRTVDKAKQTEVKRERAQDDKDGVL